MTQSVKGSLAAQQKDIPAESSKPSVSSSPHSQAPSAPAPEDLYTYENCTIMVVMQFRPQLREGGPRPVLLSVQNGTGNKEDLPLYHLLSSEEELGGPLPPALTTLLDALQHDLPARKQRHEERAAKRTASAGTATRTVQKTASHEAGKQKKTVVSPPPPRVPTTSNPLPKEGLVFSGLFDNL